MLKHRLQYNLWVTMTQIPVGSQLHCTICYSYDLNVCTMYKGYYYGSTYMIYTMRIYVKVIDNLLKRLETNADLCASLPMHV